MIAENFIDNLEKILEDLDIDEALELRDIHEFDDEWVRAYTQIEDLKGKNKEKYIKYKDKIDKLRKKAFINSYNICEDGDIAACVSDDFELLMIAEVYGYQNKWLNALLKKYKSYKFPCGKL